MKKKSSFLWAGMGILPGFWILLSLSGQLALTGCTTPSGNDAIPVIHSNNSVKDTTTVTHANDNGKDTILWIGAFAQWNLAPGNSYEGKYDSSNGIFMYCNSVKTAKVPLNQIVFLPNSNCDSSFGSRVKIMELDRTSRSLVSVLPHQVTPQTSTLSANTVQFKAQNQVITLPTAEANRYRAAVIKDNVSRLERQQLKIHH